MVATIAGWSLRIDKGLVPSEYTSPEEREIIASGGLEMPTFAIATTGRAVVKTVHTMRSTTAFADPLSTPKANAATA